MNIDFDKIICGIIVLDSNYEIININQRSLEILEFESIREVDLNKITNDFFDKISNEIETEKYSILEDTLLIVTNKNNEKYINRHVDFILESKKLKSIIISIIDVTEYKHIENNYFHSQKLESFGAVTKAISLEYNNLLAAILGFSSFLKSMINPNNETYNYLDIIEKSASKASSLTNQLMSFAGGSYFKQSYVNFNKIISQNVDLFQKTLPSIISIDIKLSVEELFINWDENQLNQIVINTILNAKESIEAKHKKGTIYIESKLEENFIKFIIKDDGIGVKPEILDKIFEPYFTTKDVGKHSGLGLSVTQGIVKNLGGIIECKIKGNNTEFIIQIPYNEIDINKIKMNDLYGNNEKILVIDDVDAMRNLASLILMQKKYIPIIADSGKRAFEILKTEKIDLILLDIIMPEMSGEDVFNELKLKYSNIPIILLTGCSEEAIVKNIVKNGEIQVIQKPFEMYDFFSKIHKVLHGE